MREVLQQVPDARLILRLYVCNPPGFASRLPAEVMRFDDGDARHFTTWYAMKDRPVEERGYPSFASEIWRRNTAEALREYVTHVRQSSYAANVIGYFVCGGGTEEWYYWGDYDHQRYALDFSPPMLRAFREDLRRFYAGDVQRLRAAWNSPAVDFASALPPEPEARRTPTSGPFWDPAHSQREIDYYYTHNKAMEDSLLIFARAIKQASNREHLVGMFHGYLQNHWLLDGGQAQLRELLASDDIDFWSGPPQYDRRGPGEHGCVRFLMRSLQRHGKLWISEADIRPSFVEPNPTNPALHGRPTDLAESLACLQREFAHQLCEGGNGWWFPMGKGWYHQPPILELFGQMQRVGQAAMACDRRPATDIAAVVDLDSLAAAPPFGLTPYLIDAFKVQELCRLGAPVDHWELDDLLQEGAPQYKLYLMLNPIRLTAARRQRIDQHLRRHGATLVWFYAPGLIDPGRSPALSLSHSRDLLGLTLSGDSATDPLMRLTTTGARLFPGFDPARSFGKFERPRWGLDQATGQVALQPADDLRLKQRFVATGAEPLATFSDGATAMAMRRGANATDLWIGGLMAPADLLRGLARHLGCHLYCDADEIIYANRSFLAIHTRAAGERTFQLRQPADVTEVFSGQVLGRGVSSFRDTIGAYRTRLYHLGDAAAWQAAQGG
ncbi:MAG: hypothetical protein HUU35_10715 [Armatimonadetes bacterium]|nr:hypothetical protein [Armatimonadota bacterium]